MSLFLGLFLSITFMLIPSLLQAEFYKYVDKNGTVHFVDEKSKIPKQYRDKKKTYKDRYDDLPEEERAALVEQDRKERETGRLRETKRQEEDKRLREQRTMELEREKLRKSLTTHVMVSGNQVFVPVTLVANGKETEAMLLLDTGATISLITPAMAAKLGIEQAETTSIRVVGGRSVKAKHVKLDRIKVGPYTMALVDVVIVRQGDSEMGDGLLGMNFLRGLKYTIDFKNQAIHWIPQ